MTYGLMYFTGTTTRIDHKGNPAEYTRLRCDKCGTYCEVKGSSDSRNVQARRCFKCHPNAKIGWWHEFGLDKNPYVYGPMPYKRTSIAHRMKEARARGWTAWRWNDGLADQRF
nr:hypothetical protein 3 [bacterium]